MFILNISKTFNQDSTWKRIFNGLNYGDALITVSTVIIYLLIINKLINIYFYKN